ncbi:MAG: signal peptidase I [Gammaproteobacteria bacterium]
MSGIWEISLVAVVLGAVLWLVLIHYQEKYPQCRQVATVLKWALWALVVALCLQALNGYGSFSVLLFVGLLTLGLIWGLAAALKIPRVSTQVRTWFIPLLVVFLVRQVGWEPYRIPSGSMRPNLIPGDFVLINRHSYAFNFFPFNFDMITANEPQRGEVVVFRHPKTQDVLIKRIIALPGDRVWIRRSRLYINGKLVRQEPEGKISEGYRTYRELWDEKHAPYMIRRQVVYVGQGHRDREWKVPAGNYFVMGDNRDNSSDSRSWGTFPRDHLLGKAELIWLTWHSLVPDFERLGAIK